jgi:hypothetical protein
MKIQVLHDKAGTICAVFAPTDSGRKGGIEAPDDQTTVIEADVPEIKPAADAQQQDAVSTTISHVLENYEVRGGRLVERRSGR